MYDAEIHALLSESLQLESSGQIGAALQTAQRCLEQALANNAAARRRTADPAVAGAQA
jgi:hypothetical protein